MENGYMGADLFARVEPEVDPPVPPVVETQVAEVQPIVDTPAPVTIGDRVVFVGWKSAHGVPLDPAVRNRVVLVTGRFGELVRLSAPVNAWVHITDTESKE